MLKAILRRESKRRKKIKAAGIDYEYPDLVCYLGALHIIYRWAAKVFDGRGTIALCASTHHQIL